MSARIKLLFSAMFGVIFLGGFTGKTWAAEPPIVINEISPVSNPEWVELYKNDYGKVSLEGCILYLDGNPETSQKITFTSSDIIASDKRFKLVEWGVSYRLNNNGDQVILDCPWGEDSIAYGDQNNALLEKPQDPETIGRSPD